MRKSLGTNFLLLFLCFLLSVICVLYCYSVMASDIPKRKVKRSLQANCVENNDHQEEHQIKSRRWKQGVSRHLASSNSTQLAEIDEMRGMDHQIKSRRSKRWKQGHSLDCTTEICFRI
ncbi:hypothetical protein ABKV19_007794 [Rosa sericea]